MSPCNKNYGSLPARCRRLAGHDGDCGPGNVVETAMCRALEATAYLRKLEREGERIPAEVWDFLMRTPSTPTAPQQPEGPSSEPTQQTPERERR